MEIFRTGTTYKISIPTKVYFGRSILENAVSEVLGHERIDHARILIVTTGRSLIKMGHLDRLRNCIQKCNPNIKIYVYDDISANPCLDEIENGVNIARSEEIQAVIGFGGGSAMDAAKAIAAGAASDTTVTEMFRDGTEPEAVLPVIAIPTTAGTGSELSKAAILTDKQGVKKGGLRGDKLYPDIAVVDSEFTETVPYKTTMETGFDVLAHAIESYVSKKASAFSEMLSEYAIKEAGKSLKRLVENLEDIEARERMSYCSMIMGINLGNTGTALPHRLQYPIGAHTNSSHGAGLAAMYPAWIKHEAKYSEEKIRKIYDLLDIDNVEELLGLMGISRKLSELGVKQDTIERMTEEVTGSIENDPASQEKDIIKQIYMESL